MKFPGLFGSVLLIVSGPVMMCSAVGANVTPKEVIAKPDDFKQVAADFKSLQSALMMYKLNAGTYPTGEQGLQSLVEKPKADPMPRRWVQVMAKIPKDPWGRDYRYVTRKRDEEIVHVIICSGPDALSPDDDVELVLEGDKK
jgi:general secretion pathway protein G